MLRFRGQRGSDDGAAVAVDTYDGVEILHIEAAYSLSAQIAVAHRFLPADGLGGQRRRAADGQQVRRMVLYDGLHHLRGPPPLADHAFQSVCQQGGGVGVHAVAAGGACGADDLSGTRRRGAYIVDGLALQREGRGFSGGQAGGKPLVGGVAAGVDASNGFELAQSTKASGDFGVDVLAYRDGISFAIQCKRYNYDVGIEAVQQVYAGRAFYECHVAMVLTNQYFTPAARKLADKIGVVLWDRDMLEELL